MTPLLLCRFAQTAAAVLMAGVMVLRLLARGTSAAGAARANRLAGGSWAVLVAAGVCQLCLTAASMSGVPFAQVFAGGAIASVLGGTRFGVVWLLRAALLAGLLVVALTRPTDRRREERSQNTAAPDITAALLAPTLLANLVWAGHANASARRAWLLPADVAHAAAAGAWPGGLLPLALLLRRARRRQDLIPATVTIARRFSRVSVAAVGMLALTGLLNTCGLVGTWNALWSGAYGRLVMCKAALFAAMIGFGFVNRRLIGQGDADDAAETLRRLWRNVAWECVLAVCVLLATEALAMSAPPASAN